MIFLFLFFYCLTCVSCECQKILQKAKKKSMTLYEKVTLMKFGLFYVLTNHIVIQVWNLFHSIINSLTWSEILQRYYRVYYANHKNNNNNQTIRKLIKITYYIVVQPNPLLMILTTFNFVELITDLIKIYTITQQKCYKYEYKSSFNHFYIKNKKSMA